MKNTTLTILLSSLFLVSIQSCKKKESTPTPVTPVTPNSSANTCLVTNETAGSGSSSTNLSSYTFSNNKLASFTEYNIFTNGITNSQVTYSGNTITIKKYLSNNTLINTEVFNLDNNGFAVNSIATGIDTVYGGSSPEARNRFDTATYNYDANGFLINEVHKVKTIEIISHDTVNQIDSTLFVIQNENIVSKASRIKFYTTTSYSQQSSNIIFTYGTTENKSGQIIPSGSGSGASISPITHKGKKSKYLVQTVNDGMNPTNTYTYILNSNGYVTTMDDGFFPRNYTYTCH